MTAHLPPVPPAARSDKGAGEPAATANKPGGHAAGKDPNTAEQGRQGNIHQNTTHQHNGGDR